MPSADQHSSSPGLRVHTRFAEPMVWMCSGALVTAIALLVALLVLLSVRGLGQFWPQPLILATDATDQQRVHLGRVLHRQSREAQFLVYRGGEGLFASTLAWVPEADWAQTRAPDTALVIERENEGPVFGFLVEVREEGVWEDVDAASVDEQIEALTRLALPLPAPSADPSPSANAPTRDSDTTPAYRLRLSTGEVVELPGAGVRYAYAPNAQELGDKVRFFFAAIDRFLSESPQDSNTQGGVFPAIVGTVTLVLLMTVLVTPLGVLAAVYLQEYAQRGPVTQLVRIAVNNLAGVPSIVYGVFGLGFFVYTLGGSIDSLFFAKQLPAPTLGTPGMLWSALTMALLTLPVVVVTTEEGLARVPAALREGSFALGATRAETLLQVILPAASPALLTGLILAIARATGEVAPLLLVGVAKYAPGLPVDSQFPFLHLDRQFMHLGFYIYDLGFQSPDLVTREGLVFATALLLVLIVLALNTAAVLLRGRLREAFRPDETL